jgi:hypothetical protein
MGDVALHRIILFQSAPCFAREKVALGEGLDNSLLPYDNRNVFDELQAFLQENFGIFKPFADMGLRMQNVGNTEKFTFTAPLSLIERITAYRDGLDFRTSRGEVVRVIIDRYLRENGYPEKTEKREKAHA